MTKFLRHGEVWEGKGQRIRTPYSLTIMTYIELKDVVKCPASPFQIMRPVEHHRLHVQKRGPRLKQVISDRSMLVPNKWFRKKNDACTSPSAFLKPQ